MHNHRKMISRWIPVVARLALVLGLLLAPAASSMPALAQSGGNTLFLPRISGGAETAEPTPGIVNERTAGELKLAPVELTGPAPVTQIAMEPTDPLQVGVGDVGGVSISALTGPPSIDLKVLVIAADGNETDYPAVTAFLRQIGIPFNTLMAAQTPLTANLLWDGASRGYYQGIILVTGNLGYLNPQSGNWESAFDLTEWETLWEYEALFGVRQLTSYTFPGGWPDNYGLSYAGFQDVTTTPLDATLTPAGQAVYPYLNAANPVTFKNAWVYFGTVVDAGVTTPLLTYGDYPIASITTYPSGRENLAVTAGNNPYLIHSLLLSYGNINWVTKGLFLGERRVTLDPQIDDLLIDTDMWDIAAQSDLTGLLWRMAQEDFTAAIAWQNATRAAYPLASTLKLEWAFNGEGSTDIWDYEDTLTPAVIQNHSNFNFVNHTLTHENLDAVTATVARTELQQNHNIAVNSLHLTNYFKDSMVQPDISGLYNPNFLQAARQFGIKYMISDTSRAGWDNPSPNAGFYSVYQPSILIIPRRPSNLFYNLSTPEEWVSEYNCFYGPTGTCGGGVWRYWDHDFTYPEIIEYESNVWLTYMLKWDIDPLMFHQANLRAYDYPNSNRSLLGDLIDATLAKYSAVYNLPIIGLSQHQVGLRMAARMTYNASGVVATLRPCQNITLRATRAARIPLTGVTYGTGQESYGGQVTSYVQLAANRTVTIPAPACQ